MNSPRVLLTGASGYVGGRLLGRLAQLGHSVRCLARQPESLERRVGGNVQVVRGDLLDPESLGGAFDGIHAAFYLVHSMGSGAAYAELDRQAAEAFGQAARRAGVRRIIYLGGLADPSAPLSRHLRSRLDTGERLRESGVPVTEFRASIVIGSGSLSFEMIRSLVERLPVMVWPRWVRTKAQPIGIDDLIAYLAAALDLPDDEASHVFEIGGSGTASYGDLMREYARQRGLRRLMVPVPFLTPRISSLWLGLVTPVYARVGRELIDGVRNASVVRDRSALRVFPIRPAGYREAMARALDGAAPETRWADARSSSRPARTWPDARLGRRIVDVRERWVPVAGADAFLPIQRIGGASGWYFGDGLWTIRGWLDLLVGGPGLRRGRRDPEMVRVGDTLDFWRVEAFEPGRRLRLQAEMRLPGRAWLEFEVEPRGSGSLLRQTATFDPAGLAGKAYWYALYPIHALMFHGMLRRIARRAGETAHARTRPRNAEQTHDACVVVAGPHPRPAPRPGARADEEPDRQRGERGCLTMRIAIVGGGISGLLAARLLSRRHDITLFEAGDYAGGHTNTVDIEVDGERHAIDTGFIVFNHKTYPNFTRLLEQLNVPSQETSMSFSVACDRTGLEYNGTSVNTLFAQRRNVLNPGFHRMVLDILRFNREGMEQAASMNGATVGEFLAAHRYGGRFREHYLVPMGASIWSCPPDTFEDFPIRFVMDFFGNHGMLQVQGRPVWRVIRGGSARYVEALTAPFADRIRLRTPVRGVLRRPDSVRVRTDAGVEAFDEVVMACHADQSLALLEDIGPDERRLLKAFPYQPNEAVLHTDARVLPRRRLAWAAWNYRLPAVPASDATVTYNMNILQRLEARQVFCVSLNPNGAIAPASVLRRFVYHHPIYTASRDWAQTAHQSVIRRHRTSFCGAYWGYGFHEDGVNSALAVCRAFGEDL